MARENDILLLPPPQRLTRQAGSFVLSDQPAVHFAQRSSSASTVRQELGARRAGGIEGADIVFRGADAAPASLQPAAGAEEGYALLVSRDGITVWAATGAGHLYGAMTLRQLRTQFGRKLPCLRIADRPALARRGVQLSFPQGHTEYRPAYMKHLVKPLARQKVNELYLYLESYFDFPSLPHMAGPGAMTSSQARTLDALCRRYHIKLIPMLNVLAHCGEILATQKYQHLSEHRMEEDRRLVRPFNLCASNPEVHALVDNMVDDMLDCFSADTIHIGGDEVSCIGECPRCREGGKARDALPLYLRYYGRVLDRLRAAGRHGGIWGDMLLHHCEGPSATARKRFLAPLREKAVIYDWHYSGGGRSSLELFTKAGMRTVACSSTHLCYSSAVWPAQSENQRLLFRDAVAAGAEGGMTTAWGNFTGLQEEQFNYLHGSGAVLLWSGATGTRLAKGMTKHRFDAAYALQRYGTRSDRLVRYLHMLGDAGGPILCVLAPLHGLTLRKCLYHTTNVLEFWAQYSAILRDGGLARYGAGVRAARRLWDTLARSPEMAADPYLRFQEGPLLMHEHLFARYIMTEAVYALYDKAGKVQYDDPARFRAHLRAASARLLAHLADFAPIERHLAEGRKALGFDASTINRVRRTKANLRELAALLKHLAGSHRPLPAFQQLYNVFLSPYITHWYGDREHDWAAELPRFQRFSLDGPNISRSVEADPAKE